SARSRTTFVSGRSTATKNPERPGRQVPRSLSRSGRKDLGFFCLELGVGEDSSVLEIGQLGQLISCSGAPGDVLDVSSEFLLLLGNALHASLLHALASSDQVDEDTEERKHDHENDPERLGESSDVLAAEDVRENADQDPDPDKEEEEPEHGP